jgi:hypothetical protein
MLGPVSGSGLVRFVTLNILHNLRVIHPAKQIGHTAADHVDLQPMPGWESVPHGFQLDKHSFTHCDG